MPYYSKRRYENKRQAAKEEPPCGCHGNSGDFSHPEPPRNHPCVSDSHPEIHDFHTNPAKPVAPPLNDLARAYVNNQTNGHPDYEPSTALKIGTIYRELNLPFTANCQSCSGSKGGR